MVLIACGYRRILLVSSAASRGVKVHWRLAVKTGVRGVDSIAPTTSARRMFSWPNYLKDMVERCASSNCGRRRRIAEAPPRTTSWRYLVCTQQQAYSKLPEGCRRNSAFTTDLAHGRMIDVAERNRELEIASLSHHRRIAFADFGIGIGIGFVLGFGFVFGTPRRVSRRSKLLHLPTSSRHWIGMH